MGLFLGAWEPGELLSPAILSPCSAPGRCRPEVLPSRALPTPTLPCPGAALPEALRVDPVALPLILPPLPGTYQVYMLLVMFPFIFY